MDERVLQFRVGVVVLSAALITGILVFIFGEGWKPRYTLMMDFDTAPGVSTNTPVRKNGILIGRVTNVELQEGGGVRLTARIDREIKLYRNEKCRVSKNSLIGDPILEFVPGENGARGDLLVDGDLIAKENTELGFDPLTSAGEAMATVNEAVESLIDLKESLDTTLTMFNEETMPAFNQTVLNIQSIAATIDSALAGEPGELRTFFDDIRTLTRSTNDAVLRFESVLGHVEELVGDDRIKADVKESLAGLPSVVQKAEMTLDQAQTSMDSFQQAVDSAKVNLDNLQGFTGPLNDNGDAMVADLQSSLQAVSEMAAQLEAFTGTLNDSEGTIGLLLNDPQLYYEFLEAVRNVEVLTRDFRPIVRDLRVAADKIARDPRQLGVKGALDRNPSGAGVKGGIWRSSDY